MQTLDFNKMMENAEKINSFKKQERKVDERFYEVIRDPKTGNTQSVIRFLANEEDDTFFIKIFTHYFTNNGRTYSSICPSTIGEKCPVCEYNKTNWNEYDEQQRESRKRKYKYLTNILVVKDPDHSEREGSVFLFRYGTKIQQKIMNLVNPSKDDLDDEGNPKKRYNIFDFDTGKNFKMKVKTVKKFPNYDESEFSANPTPIFDGNKSKQEELKKSIYLLKDQLPKKETMKSYEEMEKYFMQVVNGEPIKKNVEETLIEDEEISSIEETSTKTDVKPLELKVVEKKSSKVNEPVEEEEFFNFDK